MKKLLGFAGLFFLCSGNHCLAQGNTDSLRFMQTLKKADGCHSGVVYKLTAVKVNSDTLTGTAAGGNNDRKVSVQELMRYVSDKVPELTKGLQQPTSRRENLDFD